MPFGEVRNISGTTNISETDFGYTGQCDALYGEGAGISLSDIRSIDYNGRQTAGKEHNHDPHQ